MDSEFQSMDISQSDIDGLLASPIRSSPEPGTSGAVSQVQELQPDSDLSHLGTSSSLQATELIEDCDQSTYNTGEIDNPVPKSVFDFFQRRKRDGSITRFRKDYYRSTHIRALKKAIRQHIESKFPTTSIHKIDQNSISQVGLWIKLRNFFMSNRDVLELISPTVVGPGTDGRSRREESKQAEEKTHNDRFLSKFFRGIEIRIYNYLFTELVFSVPPSEMCDKMHIYCCESSDHTESCEKRWQDLKQWTRIKMVEELGLALTREEEQQCRNLLT